SKRSSIGASIAANSPLYPHRIVPPFLLCSVYPDRRAFLAPGTSSLHRSVDFIRPFQRRHPMRSCVRCVSCGRLWTVDGGSMSPEEPGRSTGTPAGVERMTRRDVMSRMSITVVMAKIARVTAVTLTLAVGLAAPGRAEAQSAAVIRNGNIIACAQAFENPAATLGAAVCVRNDDVSTRSQGDTVSSAMVLMWNEHAMTAIANSQIRTGGARQTRAGAMVQAAVHDALNAIDHRYEPYAIDFTTPANASADAAVAAAAHDTLLGMFPYEQTTLDALYDAS